MINAGKDSLLIFGIFLIAVVSLSIFVSATAIDGINFKFLDGCKILSGSVNSIAPDFMNGLNAFDSASLPDARVNLAGDYVLFNSGKYKNRVFTIIDNPGTLWDLNVVVTDKPVDRLVGGEEFTIYNATCIESMNKHQIREK